MRMLYRWLTVPWLALLATAASGGEPGDRPWPDLSARFTLDRTSVFVQEQFEAVIELVSRGVDVDPRVRLDGIFDPGVEWAGFHELRSESIQQDDRRYEVRRFRSRGRSVAPGRIQFQPRLHVLWQPVASPGDEREKWAFFYGRRPPARRLSVTADPVELLVRPLPDDRRPESFSGAVGRFVLDLEQDRSETRVGEPFSIRTTIEGEGNIEQVRPPVLDAGPAFRSYQPRLIAHEYDPVRGRGRKVYEFVLLPRVAGSVEIPGVAFSYFDPRAGMYRTRTHGPLALNVEPGPAVPEPSDEAEDALVVAPRTDSPAPVIGSALRRRVWSEDRQRRFDRAAEATVRSDWPESARLYRDLERAGHADLDVLFNLAVAFESKGDRARAVWYYRRAMRMRPYDPYLQQQLSRALWHAGAPGYVPSDAPGQALRCLPLSAWSWMLRLGFVAVAAGLVLLAWAGKGTRPAGLVIGAALVLLLSGSAGRVAWAWADRTPEAVVVGRDVAARFAPVPEHAVHVYLPHAAIVRIVRTAEGWRLVELGGRKGWAPADAFAPLDMDPDAWSEVREVSR